MNFYEYQNLAHSFGKYNTKVKFIANYLPEEGENYPTNIEIPLYPFIKVAIESSEVGEKVIKAALRDDNKGIVQEEELEKEIGDILWYCAEMCSCLSVTLESVAEKNIKKLLDREKRGVIQGSGDNR